MIPSARDYYYANLAPEENGQNYQKTHQSYLYEGNKDPDAIHIYNHVPKCSNDLLIEHYVSELRDLSGSEIASRLDNLFVAKRRKFFANAGALHSKIQFEGDLVFFYVGLSDVFMQYATLYQEFYALTQARNKFGSKNKKTKALFHIVCENITKLSEAQVEWGINRNEIRFKDEFVLIPSPEHNGKATSIATLMDKAVLRHEIAHHLLGHTKPDASLRHCILPHIENLFDRNAYTDEHVREIEADLAAIYLPASGAKEQNFDQLGFEVAFGTLLAQTVLAQLKASIYHSADSHPSWHVRHQLSITALRTIYPDAGVDYALSEVSRFQALLYRIQNRGLGELTIGKFDMEIDSYAS
ncbi:hypothetical protein [Paracidovorax avenae]|uniref:hypothetical protein n=1 Tax=Paracidovorax avenae TaxID=80867 RepID=UPI001AD7FDE8|nr:hypothetical protein [Paracidovorax avenae]